MPTAAARPSATANKTEAAPKPQTKARAVLFAKTRFRTNSSAILGNGAQRSAMAWTVSLAAKPFISSRIWSAIGAAAKVEASAICARGWPSGIQRNGTAGAPSSTAAVAEYSLKKQASALPLFKCARASAADLAGTSRHLGKRLVRTWRNTAKSK